MKYDIASMIGRSRGSALVPTIQHSPALELKLLKLLRQVQQAAAAGIRDVLLPKYRAKTPVADSGALVLDADEEAFGLYRALVNAAVAQASGQVRQLLELEGERHTKAFIDNARKTFSVNLKSIVKVEDLESYLDAAALRNASLIKGMADDLIKDVQRQTVDALIAGKSAAQLQEVLKERLGVSDSRARLIARDQTAKVNSDLNNRRHTDAGLTKYTWRTSQDERVRSRHRDLEGKVYEYGQPTGAEQGLPPGQPIQCRCIAQGIVEFEKAEAPLKPEEVFNLEPTPAPTPKPKATPAPAPQPDVQEALKKALGANYYAPVKVVPKPKPVKTMTAQQQAALNALKGTNAQQTALNALKGGTTQSVAKAVPKAVPKPKVAAAPAVKPPPPSRTRATGPITLRGRKAPPSTTGLDITTPFDGDDTIDAAEIEALKSGAKYASGKTNTHVREYIAGSDWREFNDNLRMGNPLDAKQSAQAAALDKLVASSKIKRPMVVYRGVSSYASNLVNLDVGDAFIDPSFMSTSVRPDVSEGFGGESGAIMRILLPKGHPSVIIGLGDDVRSSMAYEAEVLLGRGTHLRVVSVSSEEVAGSGIRKVIDLEVVPNG